MRLDPRTQEVAEALQIRLKVALDPLLGRIFTQDVKDYARILVAAVLKLVVEEEGLPLRVTPHLDTTRNGAFFSFEPHDSWSKAFLLAAGLQLFGSSTWQGLTERITLVREPGSPSWGTSFSVSTAA